MKKIISIFILALAPSLYTAQVGINTNTPNASSILDLNSQNKGVSLPKYALTTLTSTTTPISNPVNGMMIYNTGTIHPKGIYYWMDTAWEKLHTFGDFDEVFGISVRGTSDLVNSTTPTSSITGYTVVANTITGSVTPSVSTTNGKVTLPAGKYLVQVKLDGNFPTLWSSISGYYSSQTLNPSGSSANIQYQNVGVNAVITNNSGVAITETQYSNQLIGAPYGLYSSEFIFWLNLTGTSNIVDLKLFYDPLSNTLINATNASTYKMIPQQSGLKVMYTRLR